MKLLTELNDINELNRLRFLFETNGVPIYIGNEDSARNFSYFHPSGKYAVYVVFEDQYEDAMLLMRDENHVVKKQYDIEEYQQQTEAYKTDLSTRILKKVILITVVFVCAVIALVWLLVTLS